MVALAAGLLFAPTRTAAEVPADGTRRMAELLARIARDANPTNHPFLNRQRADLLESRIANVLAQPDPSPAVLVNLRGQLGLERLQAGQILEGIAELEQALALHRSRDGAHFQGNRDESTLRTWLALAWLRLGEQENCVHGQTPQSCILPVSPSAIHALPRGSRNAIHLLREQLESRPDDLRARWLLNVAAMTVGDHPARVPQEFLIPPKAFASEYDPGRFHDVAGDLGLDVPDLSGGCILDDFDGDGDLDLVASSLSLSHPLRYFVNQGDGTFADHTGAAGLTGITGGLNLLQADYDNDGRTDILVLRGGWLGSEGRQPKSLLRNRGGNTFEDVTGSAGLMSLHPTQTAAWFDYDGDGWLDLFIGHESRDGDVHRCELYRNQAGRFVECAADAGLDVVGWVKGVTAGDYNNDGRMDLYISRLGEPNLLFRNGGPVPGSAQAWRFADTTREAGVGDPVFSFPTWFFDFDNDGREDLFVGGYRASHVGDIAADYLGLPHHAEQPRLYRNRGDGSFQDVTRPMGLDRVLLAMGANFGDLDNDGWLDFYLGTGEPDLSALMPNRMFRNAGGLRFQDVTTAGGFGHLQKGHGVSFGDLDEDGDQDIYHVLGGAFEGDAWRNVLFENPGHGHRWVKLRLVGSRANRSAIGARIRIQTAGPDGVRILHRTVSSGGSFGASPLRQEIGLGTATSVDLVEVSWPGSGARQTFTNLPMETLLVLREGDPSPTVQRSPPAPFRKQRR